MDTKKILVIAAIAAIIVLGAIIGVKQSFAPSPSDDTAVTETVVLDENAGATTTEETATGGTVPKTTTKTTAPKTVPSTTPTPVIKNGVYVINYTTSGFSPNQLEIAVGKSVRWTNNSDKAMRIFSNDTGSTVFTTLNSSKTVGKGGVYEFTFLYKGAWGYHNQNNSGDTGLIIVK